MNIRVVSAYYYGSTYDVFASQSPKYTHQHWGCGARTKNQAEKSSLSGVLALDHLSITPERERERERGSHVLTIPSIKR